VWKQRPHTDWVTQVRYISELNSLLCCSLDATMTLNDVDRRLMTKHFKGHTKGVTCVVWSRSYK
jgi:WD40 repeat protein